MMFKMAQLFSVLAMAFSPTPQVRNDMMSPDTMPPGMAMLDRPLVIGSDEEFRRRMLDWSPPPVATPNHLAVSHASRTLLASPLRRMKASSLFGIRDDPIDGQPRHHMGIDLPDYAGAPVQAAADGVVIHSGWAGGYGNLIVIRHGEGLETRYGHLSRLIAIAGQTVQRGQLIGLVGETGRATGNHLHFEVRLFGQPTDPQKALQGTITADAAARLSDSPLPPVVTHWIGWTQATDQLPASAF